MDVKWKYYVVIDTEASVSKVIKTKQNKTKNNGYILKYPE